MSGEERVQLTQWQKADRAAVALQAHVDEVAGMPGVSYGDEGSMQFHGAVLLLLIDLKHLLWRSDYKLMLTELAEKATDLWAEEADELPEGSPD